LCAAEEPAPPEEAPTAEERPQRAGFKLARKLDLAPEKRERPPEVDPDMGLEVAKTVVLLDVGVPERLLDPELRAAAETHFTI
jgi:hypothetical protein